MKNGYRIILRGASLTNIFDSVVMLNYAYTIAKEFKAYLKRNTVNRYKWFSTGFTHDEKLQLITDFLKGLGTPIEYKQMNICNEILLIQTLHDEKQLSDAIFEKYQEFCIFIKDLDHEAIIEYV
jgi:bisphosphoglycerate-independent phosphoglycerate mutase (AlkP superfamily)